MGNLISFLCLVAPPLMIMQTEQIQTSIQLIDGGGNFNIADAEMSQRMLKIDQFGRSYGVISIMGPQSSGKSTLLNNLFGTHFVEMDEQEGPSQTTRGVWMAVHSSSIPIIVLDVEGCDGGERGEANLFERQTSLFNLAVSDVVLINIWNHDIGREQGAGKPLLKTIFQVMARLFNKPQKTTLMFVIRDKAGSPLWKLEKRLREDTEKLWNSAPEHRDTPMDHFFNVEVKALSHYKSQSFEKEVADLKAHLIEMITSKRSAGDRQDVVLGSEFFRSTEDTWNKIKGNEDLDIPTQWVMLARTRCGEIRDTIWSSFNANEHWCSLRNSVQSGIATQFGSIINQLLLASIKDYEEKTTSFDKDIRDLYGGRLKESLLQAVQPAWGSFIGHIKVRTLDAYKEALNKALKDGETFTVAASDCAQKYITFFDAALGDPESFVELADWNASEVRDELQRNFDEYKASLSRSKLSTLTSKQEVNLKVKLQYNVEHLLNRAGNTTWLEIRKLIEYLSESCVSEINGDLVDYGLSENAAEIRTRLRSFARSEAESKVKERLSCYRVVDLMKLRFDNSFKPESKWGWGWAENEDIRETRRVAYSSALELLSFYTAIRLDDEYEEIKKTLFDVLLEPLTTSAYKLDSQSWQDVPESRTLITPVSCKSYWEQFKSETSEAIREAIYQREKNTWMNRIKIFIARAGIGAKLHLLSYRIIFHTMINQFEA